METGRSLTRCWHGQIRLDLGKISLISCHIRYIYMLRSKDKVKPTPLYPPPLLFFPGLASRPPSPLLRSARAQPGPRFGNGTLWAAGNRPSLLLSAPHTSPLLPCESLRGQQFAQGAAAPPLLPPRAVPAGCPALSPRCGAAFRPPASAAAGPGAAAGPAGTGPRSDRPPRHPHGQGARAADTAPSRLCANPSNSLVPLGRPLRAASLVLLSRKMQ